MLKKVKALLKSYKIRINFIHTIKKINKDEILLLTCKRYPSEEEFLFFKRFKEICSEKGIDFIAVIDDDLYDVSIKTRQDVIEVLNKMKDKLQTSIEVSELEQELKEEGVDNGF